MHDPEMTIAFKEMSAEYTESDEDFDMNSMLPQKQKRFLAKGKALRNKHALHATVDWSPYITTSQRLIVHLSELTKVRIKALYKE